MNTLIALAVPTAVLLAYVAAAAASPRSLRREAARRTRRVTRHPGLANLGDVRQRLDLELSDAHAAYVLDRITRHRIDARTLWTFLDRFGADALVVSLAAGHGYAGLLRILRGDAPYDAGTRVLAALSEPELFEPAAA